MILIIGGYGQGKLDFARREFSGYKIWDDFHLFVKQELLNGKNLEQIESEVYEKSDADSSCVIICDELGCGIVPIEKFDRQWREVTGRLLCMMAQRSSSVYRVTCGIGVKIK